MKWKKATLAICMIVLLLVIVSGCASPNPQQGTAGASGVAGFWAGLWHGVTLPCSFIMSLFYPTVGTYETHNNGKFYDLGFVIGALLIGSVFAGGTLRRR